MNPRHQSSCLQHPPFHHVRPRLSSSLGCKLHADFRVVRWGRPFRKKHRPSSPSAQWAGPRRLDVLRQPSNGIAISLAHDNGHHKDLDRPDALQRHLALPRRLVQAEVVAELVLGDGVGVVDLVAEDDKRHLLQLLHGQEGVELGLGLGEALVVLRVDEEDDAVDLGEVILPESSCLLVTAQVKGREADVADSELLGGRVERRLKDRDAVVLEHVQQRRLAGVIETEEQQLGVLVQQAQAGEHIPEPVEHPHDDIRRSSRGVRRVMLRINGCCWK